jgi:hypothetical protein
MRLAFASLFLVLGSVGCSLSAGAGATARVGGERRAAVPDCDNFESCDIVYRDALGRAERCHEHGDNDDCESEDEAAALSYDALHEQTELELNALRSDAQEKDAALARAEEAAEAARSGKQGDCARPAHPPEPPAAPRHGNGWFESESPRH